MSQLLVEGVEVDMKSIKRKRFIFPLELQGFGKNPEEAWADAIEGFTLDPGPYPEDFEIIDE